MKQQEIFQNTQIDLSQLPAASDLVWRPLQRSYRQLLLLSSVLRCAVFIALITIVTPFVNIPIWLPFIAYIVVIAFTLFQILAIFLGFPYKGYAQRTHDVLYKTGWLYKKQIAVPFIRIQHVETRQGVFERAFGLSKINIYTAGGQSSDITIPGLPEDDARQLKEFILRETTSRDEEE